MKSYQDYLNESVSVYNTIKGLSAEHLSKAIDETKPLTYHHVRGMLDNKNLEAVDGLKRIIHKSQDVDHKGLGLLAMHAMSHSDPYVRQQHAYHLVGSGKLSDTQLKHISTHSVKNTATGMFDDHLAKRIHASSTNKDDVAKHLDNIKGS